MTEIIRQAKNPGQETTAHLGRRFAHFAIELGCLLDDQNARFGPAPLDQQSGGRAGKSAANDRDIELGVHLQEDDGLPPQ